MQEVVVASEDEEEATPGDCLSVRCSRQRKEPGWLVGEHRHVIFTGGGDDECRNDDCLAITLAAEGSEEWSEDDIRLPFVQEPSFCGVFTKDCFLPAVVDRVRGFRTALRRLDACILVNLLSERSTLTSINKKLTCSSTAVLLLLKFSCEHWWIVFRSCFPKNTCAITTAFSISSRKQENTDRVTTALEDPSQ
jgi:hypothetical protein